ADTDGRAHRHSKFVRQFRRSRLAEKPSPLAGDIEGSIDSFLDVAACLLQDLAHLPGHAASDLFLMPAQKLAHPVEDLAPFWRRHEAPERKRLLCGLNRSVYILRAGDRKQADQVVTIRRVMVFKGLPCPGPNPCPIDVVPEDLRHGQTSFRRLPSAGQLASMSFSAEPRFILRPSCHEHNL